MAMEDGLKFRDRILSQFDPEVAAQLVEFGKSLSSIEADFVIFMARKAVCLYDVLVRIGIPPVERPTMSNRVLDMGLFQLSGKRVALIDDTLILGTTLAKAKRQLEQEQRAAVSVHVLPQTKTGGAGS